MKFLNIVTTFLAMAVHASICDVAVIVEKSFQIKAGLNGRPNQLKDYIKQKISEANAPFLGGANHPDGSLQLNFNIATIQLIDDLGYNDIGANVQNFEQKIREIVQDPNRCMVMFLSGRRLYWHGQENLGRSNGIGKACDRNWVFLTFNSHERLPRLMAHEMGHFMGALHDDESEFCKNDRGFVMSGPTYPLRFSFCSFNRIREKLPGFTCLR